MPKDIAKNSVVDLPEDGIKFDSNIYYDSIVFHREAGKICLFFDVSSASEENVGKVFTSLGVELGDIPFLADDWRSPNALHFNGATEYSAGIRIHFSGRNRDMWGEFDLIRMEYANSHEAR